MTINQSQFDIAVIGGGPAGMMAAGRAAEKGARVLLLEKTYRIGSKLLLTGGYNLQEAFSTGYLAGDSAAIV